MRYTIFFLVSSILIFSLPAKLWSEQMPMHKHQETTVEKSAAETDEGKVEDVGNKICPVSGEKIDEETKATYEYEGKRYNFCCPMCVDEFKKDPEKYIKKIEEEQDKTKEESSEPKGMEGMHEGRHHP